MTAIMRDVFIDRTSRLLDDDPRTALVLADISAGEGRFANAVTDHPDRVINVGIREQLMVGVAGGLALTGLRPIVHTYTPFLIDRAYEQIKLDLNHQGVSAVLVSVGASYDWTQGGYTHFGPRDVTLLDAIGGWRVHIPGHPGELDGPLTAAVRGDEHVYIRLTDRGNAEARPVTDRLTILRRGNTGLVIAVGPTLDTVLAATEGRDVTIAYATTIRPFDVETLRALGHDAVAIVEPYLAGTTTHVIADALADRPHRLLSLGVSRTDLHRYGTPDDHDRWHGLDAASIRTRLDGFLP